jgi:hypothetical protein
MEAAPAQSDFRRTVLWKITALQEILKANLRTLHKWLERYCHLERYTSYKRNISGVLFCHWERKKLPMFLLGDLADEGSTYILY